ncbi:MAG: pyridoxal phosphate-dependent aminotransferase, partial [Hyphomicrobiales bacterium]|nr:pyridoxal phosphate-dependent aminotransferase [Hyphomicrobiales bacterium]
MSASPSALASQRARELKAAGEDVIALSSGEPDFQSPPHVIEAAYQAMLGGQTKYTTMSGTAELKAAVIEKFRRENNLDYKPSEVMVSTGAKQVIFNALMATVESGSEVILPTPFWIAYEQVVELANGVPKLVPCGAGSNFKIDAETLARSITPATKWFVMNSPSNPSGAVYTHDDLRALADVLLKHPHVWIMTDDIYEHIVFDGKACATIAAVEPGLKDRTIVINGVSKTYAMTGFRIGFCGGPAALLAEMLKMQSQATSGPSSVGQAAAVAALTGPQDLVAERAAAFQERRDLVVSMLNQAKGIQCRSPEGAFYVYPSCRDLIGKVTPSGKTIENDRDFVMYLMDDYRVTTVHGAAYGLSPHFRISFAASLNDLERACQRI